MNKISIRKWFEGLQDQICAGLEALDGKATFQEDLWERAGGGGGRTRVIREGNLIEKGGVNFSAVEGELSANMLKSLEIEEGKNFFATGVSIVLHPRSPMMPIIHMNVRYFELDSGIYWFGGGIDVTPHYITPKDAQFFHQYIKNVCDESDPAYYPHFKKWADDYFFTPHRNETRGIGGIFFDRLSADETHSKEQRFEFVKGVGESFVPIYTYFADQHRDTPYGEAEKEWQLLRRSRYVEFNLVYDRGTKFGLYTNGRTESILMSLPPLAKWVYDYQAIEGSREAETLSLLKKEIDWVSNE
ncbi:MAG: oxygen-dependent coproporphyrinogen oxidase [Chitinophagales bacterium]